MVIKSEGIKISVSVVGRSMHHNECLHILQPESNINSVFIFYHTSYFVDIINDVGTPKTKKYIKLQKVIITLLDFLGI